MAGTLSQKEIDMLLSYSGSEEYSNINNNTEIKNKKKIIINGVEIGYTDFSIESSYSHNYKKSKKPEINIKINPDLLIILNSAIIIKTNIEKKQTKDSKDDNKNSDNPIKSNLLDNLEKIGGEFDDFNFDE